MNRTASTLLALALVLAAAACAAPIPFAHAHVIAESDSEAVIVEKAAKVLPRPNQSAWMRLERIETFTLETWNGSGWVTAQPIASDALTTVGHRRLVRLQSPVTTDRVRVRITASRLEPTLDEIGLYKQSVDLLRPAIAPSRPARTAPTSDMAGR